VNLLSEDHLVYVPKDLSGIVAFNKDDYSTLFIRSDLRDYPHIATPSSSLNCDVFNSVQESDVLLHDLKRELIDKKIMLEEV
jgi:hypothetical protein